MLIQSISNRFDAFDKNPLFLYPEEKYWDKYFLAYNDEEKYYVDISF